jgi:acetyl esterase/lipase
MMKFFTFCWALTSIAGASLAVAAPGVPDIAALVVKVGLDTDGSVAQPDNAKPAPPDSAKPTPAENAEADSSKPCAGVSFSRGIKYGENELNVLDVATADSKAASPLPVLLFVAGESFAGDNGVPDSAGPLQDQAMCFAAQNGMIGVRMTYRLAPASPWPAGARDVAAAASWLHQNIDLFGGSRDEIVSVGYSAGATHVASFLGHPEFQEQDSGIAGAVLVSGIYRPSPDADSAEKSYFGADPSKYDERSVFPGILGIETPLLLAWAAIDPPRLVAEGEKLKSLLCTSATHCPHTRVLKSRDSLASVLGPDTSESSLAAPILEMVREIETRGLP